MPPLHPPRNMQLIRTLMTPSAEPTAVAIGNFDGLHQGHQAVLETMHRIAQTKQYVSSVLTFEPHPRRLFTPHSAPFRLEPLAAKLARLRSTGVQRVYMPRFNRALADMPAERFLDEVLGRVLRAKAVVVGENFAYGQGRRGTMAMLQSWGQTEGVHIITVPPFTVHGMPCSSSAIRQALGEGDVVHVALLLGRPYRIRGRVRHGEGRGTGLGFATANIALSAQGKWPTHGVYAVRATVQGTTYAGVANLGVRPTVSGNGVANLEVHLFDTHVMVYGQQMDVDFYGRLRGEKKFESLGELTAQIAQDCAAAKTLLAAHA